MTEKQEKILAAALELFAKQGYAATPTSKVAKSAGVSEGLIFRHFGNKEGLLNAIMDQGREMIFQAYSNLFAISDPQEIIRTVIEMPFQMDESAHTFWHLVYALKWQTETYDHTMSAPVRMLVRDAFQKLGYSDPEAEAEALMIQIDGIALSVLLRKPNNLEEVKKVMVEKYMQ